MYAGGQLLESFAEGRARRDMTALLGRVSRTAVVHRADTLETVPIETLTPGDVVLLRRGEVVPVDGRLMGASAVLDLSALTGEPMPVAFERGREIPSGATVVGDAFDLLVLRGAAASTYAGIVRLVEQASRAGLPWRGWQIDMLSIFWASRSVLPVSPMAGVAILHARLPSWLSPPPVHDSRGSVAVISGMSRAASQGVLVKTAGALEALAAVTTVVLDKTGTVTSARPEVGRVFPTDGFSHDEVLRLAASLDQASAHVAAEALVRAALDAGLALSLPQDVVEQPVRACREGSTVIRFCWVGAASCAAGSKRASFRGAVCRPPLPWWLSGSTAVRPV